MTRLLYFTFLIVLSAAASAAAQARETPELPVVVTTGEAVVHSAPDRAFVSITAESRASSPQAAQRRNTEMMQAVQDKLRAAGIPPDAIRTTLYDLQHEWDFVDGKRVSRGYVARNTIEVRVDALERLGELLDLAVKAGATSVSDVRFDLKDRSKLERDALRMAAADARARAVAAAGGVGLSLDRVVRIEEHGVTPPPHPPIPMMRAAMADQAEQSQVPIAAGQLELRARVTLTAVVK